MESISFSRSTVVRGAWAGLLAISFLFVFAVPALAEESDELTEMSLEELMNIEVTSVSKKAQSKNSAASAITVITQEDIRRGGFTQIPEALRTAPGVTVERVDASRWAISIRGNAGVFSNKLLVLIDGRTVYTPIFGGTYWDAQDYPIEDVERIEVIRGPGGTVWGENAVNGVINIITKSAGDTQGVLVSGYGGSVEHGATARFGGSVGIGEETHYRVYGRWFGVDDYDVDQNGDGNDEYDQGRVGFRSDSKLTEDDTLRISADFYHQNDEHGVLNPLGVPTFNTPKNKETGGNVLVNWDHKLSEDSSLQAKAFYSRDERELLIQSDQDMADLELQHNFAPMDNVSATWGANYRFTTVHFHGNSSGIPLAFDPNDEDQHIASAFGQIQVDLFDDKLAVIVGTKLGYNSWSEGNGFQYQPSGRMIYTPVDGHAVWGSVSRAVRTPTMADRDINLTIPGLPSTVIVGDRGTRSEELLSFELGYRFFAMERVNAEVALFWNEYDSASSFVITGFPPPAVTAQFANRAENTNRGVELEMNVLPTDWWRVKMAYSYLHIDDDPESSPLTLPGTKQKDTNPRHQFNVQSFFELPMGFEFDVSVYYVDGMPGVVPTAETDNVEQYVRLDLRLGYEPTDWLELSLVGQNLTDRRHYEGDEFIGGQSTQVPRSGYAKATLRF